MIRFAAFAVALLLNSADPAIAKNADEGPITFEPTPPKWALLSEPLPVPADARGATFIRRQDIEMHFDASGDHAYSNTLFRILNNNGLQLGNISLSWNPANGKPIVHSVKVYRDGVARDVLESAQFEVLRREAQLEQATLDGEMTAVLRVPDLRVGDELEVSYTRHIQDPTLGSTSSGLLFLSSSPPSGRYRLALSWAPEQKPAIQVAPDLEPLLKREADVFSVSLDNPATLNPPRDAPPRYNWQRIIEYSDFTTWQALSGRLAPLYDQAAALSTTSAVKREATMIATTHQSAYDRAAAALALVEQQVRYVYVGLNGGNLTPVSADDTWQRRYGDCKGKTVLLLALLRELGIPAQAVLANNAGTDDGIDARLPGPSYFDHVLVRAQLDGKPFWLDGTLPPVYGPARDPILPYRWVLPLTVGGSGLERMPQQLPTKPLDLTLFEIDASAGFDTDSQKRHVTIRRGAAALVEYLQFSSVSVDQLDAALRQSLSGGSTWSVIDKINWRFDVKEQASVLEITGTGPLDWDKEGRNSRSISLPGGGFSSPERRQRTAVQHLSVPFYRKPDFDCNVTTVRMPKATALKDWSYNTAYDNLMYGAVYHRKFDRRDGQITMVRSFMTTQTEIGRDAAARDNARLADFDNSMAWIYYDPSSADNIKPGQRIPTTFDQDWVVSSDACLSQVPSDKGK
ncbi:DUF3857 domain-containing protein [Novosphingobium sp. B 225]|uniref:DUF3857 domain-containing protein n=1 Tax=Novosphingobium sp. B 225 TaxID=1961849 RepID=UPI0020CBB0FD|nr:DUF3857 domain-containing protein [Novosphingobium sp. B 225]